MTTFDAAMILEGLWDRTSIEPSDENFIVACQHLIDNGSAWTLQGNVGRTCAWLIDQGLCHHEGERDGNNRT